MFNYYLRTINKILAANAIMLFSEKLNSKKDIGNVAFGDSTNSSSYISMEVGLITIKQITSMYNYFL